MSKLNEKEYPQPKKLYNIENDTAYWPDDAEDFIYWHSEADDWAEDYAKSYKVKMSPKDYLDLTTIQGADNLKQGQDLGLGKLQPLDIDRFNKETYQNIFLQAAFRDKDNPNVAIVTGHEGRHRMFALMQAGVKSVDVELICDVYDTEFDKYHPFKLDHITLIGQFNKSVRVRVNNPIAMSWKQHKSIRPASFLESLYKPVTHEYLDAVIFSDGEIRNHLHSVFNKYNDYDYPHVLDFDCMIELHDKPNKAQLDIIEERINHYLKKYGFVIVKYGFPEKDLFTVYELAKRSHFDSIDYNGIVNYDKLVRKEKDFWFPDEIAKDMLNSHYNDEYVESINEAYKEIDLNDYINNPSKIIMDGVVMPNGQILSCDDDSDYDPKSDVYFTDYHPLIIIKNDLTPGQYNTLGHIIYSHLNGYDYCKIRFNDNDLVIFDNYEGACSDDTGEDYEGYEVHVKPDESKWTVKEILDYIEGRLKDDIIESFTNPKFTAEEMMDIILKELKGLDEEEKENHLQEIFPNKLSRYARDMLIKSINNEYAGTVFDAMSRLFDDPSSGWYIDQSKLRYNMEDKDTFLEQIFMDADPDDELYDLDHEPYKIYQVYSSPEDVEKGLVKASFLKRGNAIKYCKDKNLYCVEKAYGYDINTRYEIVFKNDKDHYIENINESLLLEKTRQELINKSKKSDDYSKNNQGKGRNRWERRVHSHFANTVRDYNKIDMDAFFKADILDFIIKVRGETNDYQVIITFENALRSIQEEIKRNKGKLEFRCILRALIETFNRGDVYVNCSCPDFTYRQAYWATKGGYNSGTPQPSNGKMIANPNDTKGGGCKHVNLVLGNLDWMMKVASVINNYIYWARDNLEWQYAKYIFPELYGMSYDNAIQMTIDMFDEKGELKPEYADDTLKSDEDIINMSNMIGKVRGQYKTKPQQSVNPRYSDLHPKKEEPEEETDENQLTLDLDVYNEEPELDMSVEDQEENQYK